MPHLHPLFDFVVSVFIVYKKRVLLLYHKRYREWLPVGGHIELDEDPEEALLREIREECGLPVRILAQKPSRIAHRGVKPIWVPSYVDVHRIDSSHRHIALIYFGVAPSDRVKIYPREHREFRWFSLKDLLHPQFGLTKSIRFYCRKALQAAWANR